MLTITRCLGIRAIVHHFAAEGAEVLRCQQVSHGLTVSVCGAEMEPEAPSFKASATVFPLVLQPQRCLESWAPSLQFSQGHPLGVHLVLGTQRNQTQSLSRTPWCDLGGLVLTRTLRIQCTK